MGPTASTNPRHGASRRRLCVRHPAAVLAFVIALLPGTVVGAQDAQGALEAFVKSRIGPEYRAELSVGQIDPRMRLAPCARIEPYLLPGTRLWGRTTIGVRCVSGAQWALSLPLQVRIFGPALVAATPVAAGSVVDPDMVRIAQVELSTETVVPLSDPAELVGRITTRPLAAGQPIRPYHVRVRPTVNAGDPVRIRVLGAGFAISADGSALSAAGEGQALRVRTTSGKVLLGTVNGRTVDVKL